jgi:hypothetical protein
MGVEDAIEKLEVSNQKLKVDLEQLGEQFEDFRKDPKFEGLVDDLEKLGSAYLKTWINSNNDIIEILNKDK